MWKGRLGPLDLILGEDTFAPTTISTLVAEAMDVGEGEVVIDVGTGTGVLAIIAAKLGASRVFAIDNSPSVRDVGRANAKVHGVADRIEFLHGDLFEPISEDIEADVIISHHHPDHTINIALFPNARVNDHWAVYKDDQWL